MERVISTHFLFFFFFCVCICVCVCACFVVAVVVVFLLKKVFMLSCFINFIFNSFAVSSWMYFVVIERKKIIKKKVCEVDENAKTCQKPRIHQVPPPE